MFGTSKRILSAFVSTAVVLASFAGLSMSAKAEEPSLQKLIDEDIAEAIKTDPNKPVTVELAAGTYKDNQIVIQAKYNGAPLKGITIEGKGTDQTVVKLTAKNDGFKVHADDVTLKNFAITTDPGDNQAIYGLRAQGIKNLKVENLKITGMKKSGFDLNGITASRLTGLESKDNGGYGIAINQCSDIAVSGATANNKWGGVDVSNDKSDWENQDPPRNDIVNRNISGIDLSGVQSSEHARVVIENYVKDADITPAVNFDKTGLQAPIEVSNEENPPYTQKRFHAAVTVGLAKTDDPVSGAYSSLRAAVVNAQDGDLIKVYPGNYNVENGPEKIEKGENESGWYLPITQNNLTIVGVDENGKEITDPGKTQAAVYSVTPETPNGVWSSQNLVTVFGNGVTLKGLCLMNKLSPNKGVEILGNNFTAENCALRPISKELYPSIGKYLTKDGIENDLSQYGSDFYFNGNSGDSKLTATIKNNLFDHSGITFDSFASGCNVTITGNTFDGLATWVEKSENGTPISADEGTYYYKAIGNNSWSKSKVTDFTGSTISIHGNTFKNIPAGEAAVLNQFTGTFDATNNYWGSDSPDLGKLISVKPYDKTVRPVVKYFPYYQDSALKRLNFGNSDEIPTNELVKQIGEGNSAEVTLTEPGYVSSKIFQAVKGKDENVVFNVNGGGKLQYSWTFNGEGITDADKNLPLGIEFSSPNKTEIDKALPAGANPVYLHFDYDGALPGTATVKVTVGDKYKPGDKVTLYLFDNGKLKEVAGAVGLTVDADGYVTFKITHCSDYVLLKTTEGQKPSDGTSSNSGPSSNSGTSSNNGVSSDTGTSSNGGNPETGSANPVLPALLALMGLSGTAAVFGGKAVKKGK